MPCPRHSFLTRSNWNYTLEATANFTSWSSVDGPRNGTGGQIILTDTNSATARFYRVKAARTDAP